MSKTRHLLPLLTGLALASGSAADEPTLEQRLEKLGETLEAARVQAHVPGLSIAVVKDDAVVWARGFGQADVEGGRAADAETIYAIGSTTKAFTATLVGMLVDEGKASWDDPVTEYLPWFDLPVRSEDPDAACTLRDLLSHRHGFARMGILWFGSPLSREEILRTAVGAEPWDDFRAGFHYCNVTYLAAGEAAGVAAETTWDELMASRLFRPLGMDSSTLSVAAARQDPRLARGYEWDAADEAIARKKMVELDAIGPAGSVNSNVVDMAQWLRLQLGGGEFQGTRLISAAALEETRTPQIEMGGGASYGLGWMLREHDGRRIVEHGGNIDGFSAQVGLCPEESLGYVLLMNLDASPLQQASLGMVFDALLDEWPAAVASAGAATDANDFADYTGRYVANFASFRDEVFEVLVQGEALAVDVPSQRTFELKAPDAEGRWSFVLTDQIAVTFERDAVGRVVGLTMHQNGFTFEVPREGVELEPEVPREALQKYVGTYARVNGGKRVQLSIVRGRLTMEDKGQLFALHAPDRDGHAALRARAEWGATFDVGPEGTVDSFSFHGAAGDQRFDRVIDTQGGELPSVEEVLALRAPRTPDVAATGTRLRGEAWIAQAGVRGTVTVAAQGADRLASRMDFGKLGRVETVLRGGEAWTSNPMRGPKRLKGLELAQALLEHPGATAGDWREYFDVVTVVRSGTLDGRPVHVLRLAKADLPSRTYWVDAETGDVLRVDQTVIEGSLHVPATVSYSEFEERDGVRRPLRIELENPASGRTVLTFTGLETGLELGDEVFVLEEPAGEAGGQSGDGEGSGR